MTSDTRSDQARSHQAQAGANPQADNESSGVDRRGFFRTVGAAGAAAALAPLPGQAQTAMSGHMHGAEAKPAGGEAHLFLSAREAAFVEAAVDVFIPKDDVGPGGVESGCVTFIDRQLAGAFGQGSRLYRQGPFGDSIPEQGYQVALIPAELFRVGIADVNAWCHANRGGKNFEELAVAERDAVLKDLIGGKIALAQVPGRTFAGSLLTITMEGYFSDPMYGGNRNKAAWKMIGFPGAGGVYAHVVEEYRNKPYPIEPQGIADLS